MNCIRLCSREVTRNHGSGYVRMLMLIILSVPCISSAQLPSDVYGWGDTEWGMTLDELSNLLGDQFHPYNYTEDYRHTLLGVAVAEIPHYEIAGKDFRVTFYTSISDSISLRGIEFRLSFEVGYFPNEYIVQAIDLLLVTKYGPPAIDEYFPYDNFYMTGPSGHSGWRFPSTEIDFSWTLKNRERNEVLSIIYRTAPQGTSNPL